MANTKLTKRKNFANTMQMDSDSDLEPKLPLNQGNGDLVEESEELAHVQKCDNLMAQLKALELGSCKYDYSNCCEHLTFCNPSNNASARQY